MIILAEITDGLCTSIKQVSHFINDGNHVEIPSYDDNYLLRRYEDGEWGDKVNENTEPQATIGEHLEQIELTTAYTQLQVDYLAFLEELKGGEL